MDLMSYSLLAIIFMGIANFIWRLKPKNRAVIILLVVGVYGCWQVVYPSGSFHYKLTFVVDDNGKKIVASSVRTVHIQVQPTISPESSNSVTDKGEAVVIDLGEKGVLFALSKNNDDNYSGYYIVFNNFPTSGASTEKGIEYYTHLKAQKQLPFDKLPMLVRFRDINDQRTVEQIDPNNLEKTFGKGVKLISVILEINPDNSQVTTGKVKKYLRWFDKWQDHGGNITGIFSSDSPQPPETFLIPMDFIRE